MSPLKLISLVFLASLTVQVGAAETQVGKEQPYYGKQFYSDLKAGLRDEDLKNTVIEVLRSSHVRHPGSFDEIVRECSGEGCYRHTSVGYNRARVFLLGGFYLVKNVGDYAVRDVYCEKEYSSSEFKSRKPGPDQIPDDRVVNVEHTWPQSKFTQRFPEEMQKSDLHHLFPTDSEMNSARSSFPFGEVAQDKSRLKCPTVRLGVSTQSSGLIFEPPNNHKGNVARALFYFAVKYSMKIDPIQEGFLRKWNHEDPVDEEEMRRNEEIFKLQGSRNPFVDHPELPDLITDF